MDMCICIMCVEMTVLCIDMAWATSIILAPDSAL